MKLSNTQKTNLKYLRKKREEVEQDLLAISNKDSPEYKKSSEILLDINKVIKDILKFKNKIDYND